MATDIARADAKGLRELCRLSVEIDMDMTQRIALGFEDRAESKKIPLLYSRSAIGFIDLSGSGTAG